MKKLLIANRGEIAIRVMRAASELGIQTVAIFAEDDAASLHVRKADEARALNGRGAAAYLDRAGIVAQALAAGCDAAHPGYGFVSENAGFARACQEAGIRFVGPSPEILELFGDKVQARALAKRVGVPLLPGTEGPTTVEQAREFLASLDGRGMMIKAVAGGGGRGIRAVHSPDEVEQAYARCQSEAEKFFGNGEVFVERLVERARHVEVQILGDGKAVSHLGERDCSVQRRNQKLVEIAPAPGLPDALRRRIHTAALQLAEAARYESLGTFEFLVDTENLSDDSDFAFIEANPRLQVEHTITEEVTGVDLVKSQLQLASGASLADLDLEDTADKQPRGFAMQVRVNMEKMRPDGMTLPASGTLTSFEIPSGPGLRTDSFGYAGYKTSSLYDSLLAKLIGSTPSDRFEDVVARTYRGLCEFRLEGVSTNIGLLQNVLQHASFGADGLYTRFLDDHMAELAEPGEHPVLYATPGAESAAQAPAAPQGGARRAGAKIDRSVDPLAAMDFYREGGDAPSTAGAPRAAAVDIPTPPGTTPVPAPIQGTIIEILVAEGDTVRRGQELVIMDSMKMEHVLHAEIGGRLQQLTVSVGDIIYDGHPLAFIAESSEDLGAVETSTQIDLDYIRPELAEVNERHAVTLDAARPEAVARRHAKGKRTARENLAELVDPDTFVEYSGLALAAQRQKRSVDELIQKTPADGMPAGIGSINGELFGTERARSVICMYDEIILAGTQGLRAHFKTDRMALLARNLGLPFIFHAEGAGGRSGDTDYPLVGGLNLHMFHLVASLSGKVPTIATCAGRCYAGNAAILGLLDVIIATEGTNVGMGGPAVIESAGLGVFRPEDVGPLEDLMSGGVVDIDVKNEAEMVQMTKKVLGYYQGRLDEWKCADQRMLRHLIPENRLRTYDVRKIIDTLADTDSVVEMRRDFGHGAVTALIRIEGRPIGVIANNNEHLGGAIDSPAADKTARFTQLCNSWGIPILTLVDTPGMMVGPEIEKTGLVRHCSRVFINFANCEVPVLAITMRKCYGLGALAMIGNTQDASVFNVAWPTGEFGDMNLEASVKLGSRKELEAIEDPEKRAARYQELVDKLYARGKALNLATVLELDDVIDPMDSRTWIVRALESAPQPVRPDPTTRRFIDAW